jgi:choline-sulfatase
MDRPNILFLMTDQQRADALGCAGGWVDTPNLDRLAGEGVRFPNAITTSPVCIPARLSLATGLYCHNTGVWRNCGERLDPACPNWMRALQQAGYRTSLFGKTHLHPHHGDLREREDLMHAYGLDDVDEIGGPRASARLLSHMTARWRDLGLWEDYREDYRERFANKPHVVRPSALPLEEYADVYVGQRAAEYLAAYERDEPWFCWVSFGGPHEPWDAPEPYASQYSPQDMPSPTPVPEWSDDHPQGVLDQRLRDRPQLTPDDTAAMRANYAGNVSLIDDQIGQIFRVVEERGEWNNTIVVLVSDHGELNGDHGLIYKETFLHGCLGIPFIVRTPDTIGAGTVCHCPVELPDIGPTLAELVGVDLPYRQFARSLVSCLHDPAARPRQDAMSEYDGELVLLTEEWKLAVTADGEPYLLFHRPSDPEEQRNLVGDPARAGVVQQLQSRLLQRLTTSQCRLDRPLGN